MKMAPRIRPGFALLHLLPALPLLACGALSHAGGPAPIERRYDQVMAAWNRPAAPGCALGVTRHGRLVHARGYGFADLEQATRNTPRTVFDIGSVSKQFTAMSIVLLAQDGRLALDDDVHRFIPELPDYAAPVSLRQMLHHLSGLPSYTDLFDLAGVSEASLTTDDDALRLIARQKTLLFAPGEQYRYSDSNYFLLSLVVERVSGQSLRDFARQRIFAPLGMRDTHFHDDHRYIVPRRAVGYAPRDDGGYAIDMSNFEELGDGSVMTTVEDLAHWLRNFDEPVVGGPTAMALLEQTGTRNDRSSTPYAMGLIRDRYRGLERVQHSGEWVGYRAALLRMPQRHLGVILLCNSVGDLDALGLAEQIADVALAQDAAQGAAAAPALPVPRPQPLTPADRAAYAGQYWNAQRLAYLRIVERPDGTLGMGDSARTASALRHLGGGRFSAGNSATTLRIDAGSTPTTIELRSDDGDPFLLQRVAPPAAAPAAVLDYAGTYYSQDLGVSWTLEVRDGHLRRRQWLYPAQELLPVLPEVFIGALSEGSYTVQFTRARDGGIDGFTVATGMVRPMRFFRCAGADAQGPIGMDCRVAAPAPR